MKRAKLISLLYIACALSGCVDHTSNTATYIGNSTNHTITILPYQNGVINYDMYVEIGSYEKKSVLTEDVWGKTLSPCWGTLLQPFDSVVVVFDSTYCSVHLRFNDTLTMKAHTIPFVNARNITNPDNYEITVTKKHKKYENGYFTYTFTEQDYEFAKE